MDILELLTGEMQYYLKQCSFTSGGKNGSLTARALIVFEENGVLGK